jgi:hypothetical protein
MVGGLGRLVLGRRALGRVPSWSWRMRFIISIRGLNSWSWIYRRNGLMLTKRTVIITIRDLTRMISDYMFKEDAPKDMRPVKIMVNPQHQGKIGLMVESKEWEGFTGEQIVDYQIRRVYGN